MEVIELFKDVPLLFLEDLIASTSPDYLESIREARAEL